jgi:hypothetical protein
MQYIHIHDYSEINNVVREHILFVITLDPQSIQCARLSFLSSELGPSTPSHARLRCSSRLWVQGVGGPNSDEGTYTPVLYVYYNSYTVRSNS